MSFKCLIVDDEPIAQNIIKGFIADIPNLQVFGTCDNAMEALQILKENIIDILFLDIEMPKITGLSFLKTLNNPPATIITTAHREFALEGFELNVVDYLLKPFSFERFLRAINKIEHSTKDSTPTNSDYPDEKTFEFYKVDRKNVKVIFDDILYIEGLSNYVKIFFEDHYLVVYQNLKDLEKSLPKRQFARIHKSYIVALNKIKAFNKDHVEISEKQFSIGNTYKEKISKIMSGLNG